MTEDRYHELMYGDTPQKLTKEELAEGWHFCTEWDYLLVGPKMEELHACSCLAEDHPVYKTKPPMPEMHIECIDDLTEVHDAGSHHA
jgi:hypothetical protein